MELDTAICYEALLSHDARFDGVFFVGVATTGIYCRTVCPARTPRRDNCTFYPSAAAAERAGYRPCLRCRPELAPGSARIDSAGRLAATAASRIEDGELTVKSVSELARSIGITDRHLRRVVQEEFGVSPIELAQTQRLLLAKRLLTDTDLPITQIAFAAGFSSLRRFNAQFKERYRLNPTELRKSCTPIKSKRVTDSETKLETNIDTKKETNTDTGTGINTDNCIETKKEIGIDTNGDAVPCDALGFELSYRPPLDWQALLDFLVGHGSAGVETRRGNRYLRTVRVGAHRGWLAIEPVHNRSALRAEISGSLVPALRPTLARVKRLCDLDAEPVRIAEHLGALTAGHQGIRVPGAFDGFELATRAILGQQVSVKGATTLAGRFVAAFGEEIVTPVAELNRLAPTAERMASVTVEEITQLGIIRARANSILALARAMVEGKIALEPGADVDRTTASLQELPGIGPWTAQYIAMRALAWPDAFPHTDLGIVKALGETSPKRVVERAEAWRPWRSYATMYLWKSLEISRNGKGE